MSKKVKWGVIGSGGIARRRTIPEGIVAADNAELVGTVDLNTKVNGEVAKEFGAKPFDSEKALLESKDIDAVYLATPAITHHDQTLAAAANSKHVLCEKPMGLTNEEAANMMNACKKAGVKLGVGFMMRFHAYHQEALRMVKEGKLGTLVLGRAQLSCWYPPIEGAWRQDPVQGGGGSLMDLGGHCIDLLEMFFGPVKTVSCRIGNLVQDYKSEDTATTLLEFEDGSQGVVDNLFNVPDASVRNCLELYGSQGSILAEGTIGQAPDGTMVAHLEESGKEYNAQQQRDETGGLIISPEPINTYEAEIAEFSQAILEDREPSNGAEEGARSTQIIVACYESARTGKVIEL